MKKITTFILASLCILIHSNINAQGFEGKMVMKTEAIGLPAEYESMKSMFEMSMTFYSKGQNSRMETIQPMLGEVIVITDVTKKESIVCMNLMGEKIAVKSALGGDDTAPKGQFTLGDKSKTICGYKCQNAIYTDNSGEKPTEIEIWYTKDIENTSNEYYELPGMPMEYTIEVESFKLHYFATSVEKQKISNSMFDIPEGYALKNESDVQNLFPSGK